MKSPPTLVDFALAWLGVVVVSAVLVSSCVYFAGWLFGLW